MPRLSWPTRNVWETHGLLNTTEPNEASLGPEIMPVAEVPERRSKRSYKHRRLLIALGLSVAATALLFSGLARFAFQAKPDVPKAGTSVNSDVDLVANPCAPQTTMPLPNPCATQPPVTIPTPPFPKPIFETTAKPWYAVTAAPTPLDLTKAVAAQTSAGITWMKLGDVTGVKPGMTITLGPGLRREETKTIVAVSGDRRLVDNGRRLAAGTITLDSPLKFGHSAGEKAVVHTNQASCSSPAVANGGLQFRYMYESASVALPARCKKESQNRMCTNGAWGAWGGTYTHSTCHVQASYVKKTGHYCRGKESTHPTPVLKSTDPAACKRKCDNDSTCVGYNIISPRGIRAGHHDWCVICPSGQWTYASSPNWDHYEKRATLVHNKAASNPAPTPAPPAPSECYIWCGINLKPWDQKCTWPQCSGCQDCSRNVHTT